MKFKMLLSASWLQNKAENRVYHNHNLWASVFLFTKLMRKEIGWKQFLGLFQIQLFQLQSNRYISEKNSSHSVQSSTNRAYGKIWGQVVRS